MIAIESWTMRKKSYAIATKQCAHLVDVEITVLIEENKRVFPQCNNMPNLEAVSLIICKTHMDSALGNSGKTMKQQPMERPAIKI